MKYTIRRKYIQTGTKRRGGSRLIGPKFIVAHGTGNPGSTAENNVNYYIRTANESSASAHTFVDDRSIIECIPINEKAWHVRYNVGKYFGYYANDAAVGVEMCYGGQINNVESYKRYVWYIAYLCYINKIDPISRVVGHYVLDPGRRTDPKDAFKYVNKSMSDFIKDLKREYDVCTGKITETDKMVQEISDHIRKEDPSMAEIFKPNQFILTSVRNVLANLQQDREGKQAIDEQWLQQLEKEKLTSADAIGLLYVAIDRGLLANEKK